MSSVFLHLLVKKIPNPDIFFQHLVNNTSVIFIKETHRLLNFPHVSIHSSRAYGRKVTWADWFMIPRTTDRLMAGYKHERDLAWVMTCLSYLKLEGNLVNGCCNPLTTVEVEALLHLWDFLSGFPLTCTSKCCARPNMLGWYWKKQKEHRRATFFCLFCNRNKKQYIMFGSLNLNS